VGVLLTPTTHNVSIRGVQIRSESDPIRSDFGTKIYISDRIGLIKLLVGSDRTSIFEIIIHALLQELITMHLSKHYRGCRCIIRLILQLDVTLSASGYVFLVFIFIWLNIST
jgi:hypothetical protein